MLLKTNSYPNSLNEIWNLQNIFRKWPLLRVLIRNLQTCKVLPYVFLKLLKQRPWWSSFFQKQALTGSLQNNCSKQQLKPFRKAGKCYEKDFLMDFLLHNRKRKINFLQCRCWCQCQCWCRYFQMVLQNYTNHKNSGTGNWVWALLLKYSQPFE